MTQWYIQADDGAEDRGPFRPSELLEMVRNGEVTRESMLRKDESAWFLATDVGGLFEAALRPTIEYFCPQCESEVTEPPVICKKCGREIRVGLTNITEHTIIDRSQQSAAEQVGGSMKRWLSSKKLGRPKDDRK